MRIGILSNYEPLHPWLTSQLPELEVFEEVSPGLLSCDKILLLASYSIGNESYQIVNLWEQYLGARFPEKHLILVGVDYQPSHPNYLSFPRPPQSLPSWMEQTQSIQELATTASEAESDFDKVDSLGFPLLKDHALSDSLKAIMNSHGDTFHSTLIDLRISLWWLSWRWHDEQVLQEQLWKDSYHAQFCEAYHALRVLWRSARHFFAWFPDYPVVKEVEAQLAQLAPLVEQQFPEGESLEGLATGLGTYVGQIQELFEFYGFGKEEEQQLPPSGQERGKILVIDDEEKWFDTLKYGIKKHKIIHAWDRTQAKKELDKGEINLVVLDLDLVGGELEVRGSNPQAQKAISQSIDRSLAYVGKLRQMYPSVQIAVLSKYHETDRVLLAGKNGADEYWYKGAFNPNTTTFRAKVNRLVAASQAQKEKEKEVHTKLWGNSIGVRQLDQQLVQQAIQGVDGSFILQGERGCGKENAVRYLLSIRTQREEVRLPLIQEHAAHWEAEAEKIRQILHGEREVAGEDFLQKARSGILYIRQIELVPLELQKMLAELVLTQSYLNSNRKGKRLQIQWVLGTTLSADELYRSGQVAERLLNQLPVLRIPALRDRREDIPLIIQQWLELNGYPRELISKDLRSYFQNHDYPGNVFELLDVIEEVMAHHRSIYFQKDRDEVVSLQSLPRRLRTGKTLSDFDYEVARIELEFIDRSLAAFGGNKQKAAEALNNRNSDNLRHYIKKYRDRFPDLLKQFEHITKAYPLKQKK